MKFNHYYEKLFGTNLYWFRGSYKDYTLLVKKKFNATAPEKQKIDGTFQVYKLRGTYVGVIWLHDHDFSVLAHECFHAVHWNLADRGITLTDSSEETYAYLLMSLVKELR